MKIRPFVQRGVSHIAFSIVVNLYLRKNSIFIRWQHRSKGYVILAYLINIQTIAIFHVIGTDSAIVEWKQHLLVSSTTWDDLLFHETNTSCNLFIALSDTSHMLLIIMASVKSSLSVIHWTVRKWMIAYRMRIYYEETLRWHKGEVLLQEPKARAKMTPIARLTRLPV